MTPPLPGGGVLPPQRGEEGVPLRSNRRLYAPAALGSGVVVYSCHPYLVEQGVAESVVLPPQRRRAAAGVHTPRRSRSGGVLEVGLASRALDPPVAATRRPAEAPGSWPHCGWGRHRVPLVEGSAADRASAPPRRYDARGLRG
jgi:hypothetical protein